MGGRCDGKWEGRWEGGVMGSGREVGGRCGEK